MASRQIPWLRLFAEGIVIISSVFVALAADAWRQGRQDRVSEAAYLESLLRDLRTDSLEYESVSTMLGLAEYSTSRTLAIATASSIDQDDPAVMFVYCASYLPLPVVTRGTLDDLLSTGSLQLLRDRDLRRSLLEYYASVEAQLQFADEYRENQQHYREILAVLRLPERFPELVAGYGPEASVGSIGTAELARALPETAGLVAALNRMLFSQRRMLLAVAGLTADVTALIPQLEGQLDSRGAAGGAIQSRAPSSRLEANTRLRCPSPPGR